MTTSDSNGGGHRGELPTRETETELLRRELEQSNDRLLAFAGQVTHDLKTPLTTMALSLELVRDELELGSDAADLVPLINRALGASERMTDLIEGVLSFARLAVHLEPVPVDLMVLALEVTQDLVERSPVVDLEVDDLPTVQGDEALLRALLRNLVSNAIKFQQGDAVPTVAVSAHRRGARWRIEVADNGIGVPVAERERIFEPMVRLDKRFDGIGVGLATCQRVVDAHHGTIGVTDNPAGQGSTFWVELPA